MASLRFGEKGAVSVCIAPYKQNCPRDHGRGYVPKRVMRRENTAPPLGGRRSGAARAGCDGRLFEFKVVEGGAEGTAIAQLREKGCADKYRRLGRLVHLIGVEFSREERNVAGFDVETS